MSLLELTAVELAKEIKAGKTTAVEAMKAVLEQIEKTEETYHCYITIDKEKAMHKYPVKYPVYDILKSGKAGE